MSTNLKLGISMGNGEATTWRSYEEVASYLLNRFAEEFGFSRFEGKQSVDGKRSGTTWEIDAKGIRQGGEGFVIVECRRYTTSKQNQEKVGALAYRILDIGAIGGIVVTPLGIQAGAQRITEAEGIISIQLHKDSTPTEFAMQFLNKIFVGIHEQLHASDCCDADIVRRCAKCGNSFQVKTNEKLCPTCDPDA
jgi:hypothetical protein